jgi:hypothetical protein
MIRNLCLTAAVVLCLSLPSNAGAYWPYLGYGGYGYGWGFNQATDYIPAPPYFAVHPPVYYAPHITARHYGASPYAWLPGMQPITYVPEGGIAIQKTQPVMLANTFITEPGATSVSAVASTDVKPLKIENPFVVSARR